MLDKYHKGHYMVYNLCSERTYDPSLFHGQVRHTPFDDHNAPPLSLLIEVCRSIEAFLDADDDNVVAVHCKAGKGRTGMRLRECFEMQILHICAGTVIAAFLLYNGDFTNAADSLNYFGMARTVSAFGMRCDVSVTDNGIQRKTLRALPFLVKGGMQLLKSGFLPLLIGGLQIRSLL